MEIKPPTIASSQNSPIPYNLYVCRLVGGAKENTEDKGLVIKVKFEILSPDIVPHPSDSERQLKVAGRKANFTIYASPIAKLHEESLEMLKRLGLTNEEGGFDVEELIEQLKSGQVCAEILVSTEEDFAKHADGKFLCRPGTNDKISLGHRISFIFPKNIIQRVDVEGLPPMNAGAY